MSYEDANASIIRSCAISKLIEIRASVIVPHANAYGTGLFGADVFLIETHPYYKEELFLAKISEAFENSMLSILFKRWF